MDRRVAPTVLAAFVVAVAGCSGDAPASGAAAASTRTASTATPSTPAPVSTVASDPALRDELLAMLAADQADRAGEGTGGVAGDRARTARLQEIVASYGWPTRSLVGGDGATAAWAVAQHSDLDPEAQAQFLDQMRAAVEAGEADRGELAYLVDRVAANAGEPQTYGTQIGCSDDGEPQPAPLAEPDRVDELRAEAGLQPLDAYLAELEAVCASS